MYRSNVLHQSKNKNSTISLLFVFIVTDLKMGVNYHFV